MAPFHGCIELRIISKITRLRVKLRSEDEADGVRREVLKFAPNQRWNIRAIVGLIQVITVFPSSIIKNYVETTRYGNYELMASF